MIDRFNAQPTDLAPAPAPTDSALRGVLSDHSRRAYAGDFADFARYLHPDEATPALTRDDLVDVSADDLAGYRDWLRRERKLATTTVNRRIAALRKLFGEAVARGIRKDNPAKAIKGFKGSSKETPGLTEDEARRLLGQVDRSTLLGLRDYALLQVLIRLGLRREEATKLRLADFGQQRGRRTLQITGKGEKQRLAVLPGDVYDHVVAWVVESGRSMEDDAPLFVQLVARGRGTEKVYRIERPDVPMSAAGIWYVVTHYAEACGLETVTPHSMRATFVTLALAAGAPLQKVQYAAGHSDPRTTERYDRNRQQIDNPATDYLPVL